VSWRERAKKRFYDPAGGWIDGTDEFHALLAGAVEAPRRILEIGAGPSNPSSRFLATLGQVTGLDVDPDVRTNTDLARAEVFDGSVFPFADATFDLCASNYVLEHVPDPRVHFEEVRRVLRPGGAYVFRTPNRYHYVALVSSMTPHWFHKLVANRLRGLPAEAHDPYPTVYRANTAGAVRRLAGDAGLTVHTLRRVEKDPSYGMASPLIFYPLVAYERFVNSSERWGVLRANLFVVLRKT
jgi:SAM-dependent methyltransferase